ncbi:hypothetical protein FBU59_002093 [Linderina macrospora]|uniref:Uncharacterized protein n=1 Tax=Linderina macrospora TaxID=4868 RepID=A0ACC1JC60_9FUNG|nr:hypothetical protein FBU59_002093 [Linderina macrospora]
MVLSQFRFHHTSVALVLNHGINAAYYECASKIPKIAGSSLSSYPSRIAVNTELAAYGKNSSALRPTMWDNRIDRESSNPQEHIFEKMVADKYLGEIVRNLVTDFMDAQLLFPKNADVAVFTKPFSFFTSYMTVMEDTSENLSEIGMLLSASFNVQASLVDRHIVRALCNIAGKRAALLMGAAAAALVRRATEAMQDKYPALVSVSGQLTEMNQVYVQTMIDTATQLVEKMGLQKPTFNVLGEDGYTVGAAIAALSEE